jgi:hypothetical protein
MDMDNRDLSDLDADEDSFDDVRPTIQLYSIIVYSEKRLLCNHGLDNARPAQVPYDAIFTASAQRRSSKPCIIFMLALLYPMLHLHPRTRTRTRTRATHIHTHARNNRHAHTSYPHTQLASAMCTCF